MILIEKFSTKRPLLRRQYSARVIKNGRVIWRTSESYNNRADRDHAINILLEPMKAELDNDDPDMSTFTREVPE